MRGVPFQFVFDGSSISYGRSPKFLASVLDEFPDEDGPMSDPEKPSNANQISC